MLLTHGRRAEALSVGAVAVMAETKDSKEMLGYQATVSMVPKSWSPRSFSLDEGRRKKLKISAGQRGNLSPGRDFTQF